MKHAKKYSWSSAQTRPVFKSKHGHDPVTLNQGEFEIFQDVNAVKSVTDAIFERQGLYHSNDQAVEGPRAGTRSALGKVLPGQILNKRVTDFFKKGLIPAEAKTEHGRGVHRHFQMPPGVFGKIRGFFHKLRVGENGLRFEQEFGSEQYDENTRVRAAARVLAELDNMQLEAVQHDLARRGVPLPDVSAQTPVGLAANPMYPLIVLQFASAMPDTIAEMRATLVVEGARVFSPLMLDPLHRTTEAVPPAHAIDRFLQLRKVEGRQSHNMQITTMYDTQRLGNVMRTMETDHPKIYKLIVEEILENDALHAIQGVPETEALIHYLEQRVRSSEENITMKEFVKELEGILGNIPDLEKKKDEKKDEEKNKAEIKKLEGQVEKVMNSYGQLDFLYAKAPGVGKDLFKWNKNYLVLSEKPAAGGNQQKGQESNLQTVNKNVRDAKTEKDKMYNDIHVLEETLLKDAEALYKLLKDKDEDALEKNAKLKPFIKAFITDIPDTSDEESLFGKTEPETKDSKYADTVPANGKMRKIFDTFKARDLKEIKGAIEEDFSKGFKKKTKLSPFELLKALMEGEFARKGIVAPENRSVNAMAAAEVLCSMARRKQIYRSGNLERQEWLATGTFGRAKKWLKARYNIGGMETAEDLIDKIAGIGGMSKFRGLPKGVSAEEFINFVDQRGIDENSIFEFARKLEEVFKRFEKYGHEGTVQLYDQDAYNLEELTELMMTVRSILRSRRYHLEEVRPMEGDKGLAIFEHIRAKRKGDLDDQKGLLQRIMDKGAEWKSYFSPQFLKKKFFDTLVTKKKEASEQKLSQAEFEHGLDHDGLRTAYDALRTALAVKEAADVGVTAAKWTGAAGKKFGRGVHTASQYGIARPVSWAFGKSKAAVTTVGKAAFFPFVLAGSIVGGAWNWAKKPLGGKSSGGGHAPATHP